MMIWYFIMFFFIISAYIIENDLVVEALEKVTNNLTTDESKNLQIWHNSKVKQIDLAQEDLKPSTIILENEKTIQTSLVIGADGANSKLRQSMSHLMDYTSKDYQQMGLVGTITFEDSETRDDIGKKHALKKYDQFALNTSWF